MVLSLAALRSCGLAVSNEMPHFHYWLLPIASCLISDLTIFLIGGIMNADIPINAIPVPEIKNALAIPIESAMNPVASKPIIDGSIVMLE